MALLTLRRDAGLSEQERAAIPAGANILQGHGDQIVRYQHNGTTADLVELAFCLGQAVAGATIDVRGIVERRGATPVPATEPAAAQSGEPAEGAPAATEGAAAGKDPWKLLDAGDHAGAVAAFASAGLDSPGRDRVRALFKSTDPEKVALSCRIAAATNWRAFTTNLRRLGTHADVRVRRDAAVAIGRLAGPSLEPLLERLSQDTSPEVRAAALEALEEIASRQA